MHQTALGIAHTHKWQIRHMTCIEGASQLDQGLMFFFKEPDSKQFIAFLAR